MATSAPLSFEQVAETIRRAEVGRRARIRTPFGSRLTCYADLTATGRYLHFIEDWLRRVRPYYANTHTAVSSTGRIVTALRDQARQVVRRGVGAGEQDHMLFVGCGATAAVNKLVGLLGLRIDQPLDSEFGFSSTIAAERRPVVFVGPYEHHSNQLPWLESVADVVEVDVNASGGIDQQDLQAKLAEYAGRPLKVGSFSAASNVSGVLSDVHGIARTLHRGGAWAVFDYAAAAPYVPIDMHPAEDPEARLDAVFLSTHKFVGGPEASGILVAHEGLFRTARPERPGGGTVDYVAAVEHGSVDYVGHLEDREEGGTPNILGDLRAGAAFLVKEMLGAERILAHEQDMARRATERLSRHPRIELLGPTELPRLGIVSFNVTGLHHDLVSALLDHLFGIQNRAGCSCAGPYGHRLLGIDRETSARLRKLTARNLSGVKPGWVRLSLPYYASEEDLEFMLSAVEFVADHGQAFVPLYEVSWASGVWQYREHETEEIVPLELTVDALQRVAGLTGEPEGSAGDEAEEPLSEADLRAERADYFREAHRLAEQLKARWAESPPQWNRPTGEPEIDALRWFDYVYGSGLGGKTDGRSARGEV